MRETKEVSLVQGGEMQIESRDLILLKRSISEFRQPNVDRTGGGRILEKKELHRYSKGPPQVLVEY